MAGKKNSISKFALGAALFALGLLLVFARQNATTITQTDTFAQEPVSVQGFEEGELDEARVPQRVIIPDLAIDLEVEKAEVVGGYWEVFADSAAWGTGSGLPGEAGNQVIFAHAREGLFLPLRSIEVGQKVYVLNEDEWYKYEVYEIKEVYPNQVEVIAPTEDETLTLYTCSGYQDSKRLIVIAKPV